MVEVLVVVAWLIVGAAGGAVLGTPVALARRRRSDDD